MTIQVISSKRESTVYIVFGLGLLGNRVSRFLIQKLNDCRIQTIQNDWNDTHSLAFNFSESVIRSNLSKVEVIWSAGRSGFSSSDHEMESETNYLIKCIEIIKSICSDVSVNFISSAGGIYEGVGEVTSVDNVAPLRPYGHWKLKQEDYLKSNIVCTRVYRVSSVYGVGEKNNRMGLINTLVARSITGGYMNVFGHQSTLRDYIYHDDVASYIVDKVFEAKPSNTQVIASGRATSINILQNMVEQITGRFVNVTFQSLGKENDIVFDSKILPATLNKTTIEEGVRLVNAQFRSK